MVWYGNMTSSLLTEVSISCLCSGRWRCMLHVNSLNVSVLISTDNHFTTDVNISGPKYAASHWSHHITSLTHTHTHTHTHYSPVLCLTVFVLEDKHWSVTDVSISSRVVISVRVKQQKSDLSFDPSSSRGGWWEGSLLTQLLFFVLSPQYHLPLPLWVSPHFLSSVLIRAQWQRRLTSSHSHLSPTLCSPCGGSVTPEGLGGSSLESRCGNEHKHKQKQELLEGRSQVSSAGKLTSCSCLINLRSVFKGSFVIHCVSDTSLCFQSVVY